MDLGRAVMSLWPEFRPEMMVFWMRRGVKNAWVLDVVYIVLLEFHLLILAFPHGFI